MASHAAAAGERVRPRPPLAFLAPAPPSFSFRTPPPTIHPSSAPRPYTRARPTCTAAPQRRRKRKPDAPPQAAARTSRGFLGVLDDMMEKQYGRGKLYYGPSAMRKQEETALVDDAGAEEDEWEDLKPNPVLVAGGTGRSGQWVVLGLLNQGFNVRVLTRSFERAEQLFGESGGNVDVFEADLNATNDDDVELAAAVRGARAVVFIAGNGSTSWFGAGPPPPAAINLLEIVSREAPDIHRFVLVAQGKHQDAAESRLVSGSIPYVVVRPGKLSDEEGGLKTIRISSASSDTPSSLASNANANQITRLDLAQVVCLDGHLFKSITLSRIAESTTCATQLHLPPQLESRRLPSYGASKYND